MKIEVTISIWKKLCSISWKVIWKPIVRWMMPSKSGSKYSLKNIMTENIWKIFAPWRGPQVKLLFSTFFQVTVYLVDTQNFRVTWRPLHVFCKYLCKYWSYLIKKYLAYSFGSCLSCKKGFNNFGWKLKSQYQFEKNYVPFPEKLYENP